jgi:hypothetical protein
MNRTACPCVHIRVRRLLLVVATLAACGPLSTAATPTPAATEPIVLASASPAATASAPAATAATTVAPSPSRVASETETPTEAPSAAPTATVPAPTFAPTPRPVPLPTPAPGPVKNDGQRILVSFDPPQRWFFGEASASGATQATNYTLNGKSLAGSALKCTGTTFVQAQNLCTGVEIIPSTRLLSGERYELKLLDVSLGTFVASGLIAGTPKVEWVKATQFELTVKFDRPMLHVGQCGTQSWTLSVPGTMEWVRAPVQGFPAPVGGYTSSSAAYRDFLSAFVSAADISDDCTTVKLGSGWGGPTGTFDVTVQGIADMYGNLVEPRTIQVEVQDEGNPRLMFAQLELQTAEKKVIRVAYSEAMDEEYVTDVERYYLNGKRLAPTTKIECAVANCTWARLTFAPTAFTYGAPNTLTIVGVRDMAGNEMDPNIVTSGTFEVR